MEICLDNPLSISILLLDVSRGDHHGDMSGQPPCLYLSYFWMFLEVITVEICLDNPLSISILLLNVSRGDHCRDMSRQPPVYIYLTAGCF